MTTPTIRHKQPETTANDWKRIIISGRKTINIWYWGLSKWNSKPKQKRTSERKGLNCVQIGFQHEPICCRFNLSKYVSKWCCVSGLETGTLHSISDLRGSMLMHRSLLHTKSRRKSLKSIETIWGPHSLLQFRIWLHCSCHTEGEKKLATVRYTIYTFRQYQGQEGWMHMIRYRVHNEKKKTKINKTDELNEGRENRL